MCVMNVVDLYRVLIYTIIYCFKNIVFKFSQNIEFILIKKKSCFYMFECVYVFSSNLHYCFADKNYLKQLSPVFD